MPLIHRLVQGGVAYLLFAECCRTHASASPPGSSPLASHPESASLLQVSAYLDPAQGVLLLGHSRGAKLSVLAAAADSRVRALALLDPVNNTVMTPSGPGYPSALPPLR